MLRFIRLVSLSIVFSMIALSFPESALGAEGTNDETGATSGMEVSNSEVTSTDIAMELSDSEVTGTDIAMELSDSEVTGTDIAMELSGSEVTSTDSIKATTTVSGLIKKTTRKARSTFSDTVKVKPAHGRTTKLQMKSDGKWITKKTYKLSNSETVSLKITYPNAWWKKTKSTWRLIIPEGKNAKEYVSPNITITTKRYYQTPGNYFKVKDIPTRKSGYTLKPGMSGLKVYKVQKKLGCYYGKSKYTSSTAAKVRAFQKKKGLKATGQVNLATWLKMGFTEKDWYYLDSYVTPSKVNPSSTKQDCINAMVKTAKEYLGTKYIWCAAARPGQGVDCAGLVLQCLYATGIDPLPSGSHVYAYSRNEYTTRRLWANKKFKHVSWSQKRKGDIIVYHNGAGVVNHVSLYIGGGMEIESLPGPVRYDRAGGHVKGVLRPII